LLGSVLILISIGPYYNWDSQVEYAAASGIVKWGLPYITVGNLINEPPLAYYIDALFFKTFDLSYWTGIGVATLFGIGCVLLVYEIGKILYGQRTGLLAAALFTLTPWHVVMSRVFLADGQCLFFSLLYLLVGIWALRKGSLKILSVSGVLFGVALLTKLFAIFMLIPLSLIYVYWRPRDLRRALGGITLFFLPVILLQLLWYQFLSGRGMLSFFGHDDLNLSIPNGIVPPYFLS
jgi:4-amino-4-deoxy-L-arabinose transferase-like glycosyltransferase